MTCLGQTDQPYFEYCDIDVVSKMNFFARGGIRVSLTESRINNKLMRFRAGKPPPGLHLDVTKDQTDVKEGTPQAKIVQVGLTFTLV